MVEKLKAFDEDELIYWHSLPTPYPNSGQTISRWQISTSMTEMMSHKGTANRHCSEALVQLSLPQAFLKMEDMPFGFHQLLALSGNFRKAFGNGLVDGNGGELQLKMVSNHHYTRVDTLELRDLIYRKIGQQRAEKYFNELSRFFSSKLSKVDFDKSCIRTVGRENIHLHNRLLLSIVKNASLAKVPPPKPKKVEESLSIKVGNGYQRSCLQSLYGDAFPSSPRKTRSPVSRDRRLRDRPSPLGPLGKSPVTCEEAAPRIQEQQSATELHSLGSRPPVEVASVEDGEEVEQFVGSPGIQSRSLVTAPLGISVNVGGARKTLHSGSVYNFNLETCQSCGELPDSRSLRSRLERKLESEGLVISLDCANLLNNSLDAFLKRLIEPCIQLAGSQHTNECVRHRNGQILPGWYGQSPGNYTKRQTKSSCASMLDFRVAMETNPRILGGDWSTLLEKVCASASE
ncbi:hypothetical protein RND71_000355 [Anisodus tanguticus]|uniref:Transcriptional adapter 1 n=1 Tax=Anisodus tanguticus TaxID=243964 RepID=A0AAE1SVT2_9SOLA|nr:hypothetical protein RND71_000355 [Anisodus tanguticus]